MKRIMTPLLVLTLTAFVAVLLVVSTTQAKCGKKSKMNMEGMDHSSGMCCALDHQMEMKQGNNGTPTDHSKMENSSAETDSQVAMATLADKEKPQGKEKKSGEKANQSKVKDPVCGMEIDAGSAAGKTTYRNKTYYFCSLAEKEQFEKSPEKYVK